MDAAAYLNRQGWKGDGHSLDPHGRGIKKRLLVSKRPDGAGLGKRKNDVAADQWWQGAFDGALKGLQVGSPKPESTQTSGTATPDALVHHRKWTGLYASFVRGTPMEGTISPRPETEATSPPADGNGRHVALQPKDNHHEAKNTHIKFDNVVSDHPEPPPSSKAGRRKKTKRESRTSAQFEDDPSTRPQPEAITSPASASLPISKTISDELPQGNLQGKKTIYVGAVALSQSRKRSIRSRPRSSDT